MRIESITEGTGSSLHPRAYEQVVSARFATIRRDAHSEQPEPSYDGVAFKPALVVDIQDSPERAQLRQEAAVYATTALTSAAPLSPRTATGTQGRPLPKVDTDGDGWADNFDLPFDYFRIRRQAAFTAPTHADDPATT